MTATGSPAAVAVDGERAFETMPLGTECGANIVDRASDDRRWVRAGDDEQCMDQDLGDPPGSRHVWHATAPELIFTGVRSRVGDA